MSVDRDQRLADAMVSGVLAVLVGLAYFSLGSDVEGGMGEFFGLGVLTYAGSAFLGSMVTIDLLRWWLGAVRTRAWRYERSTAIAVGATLVVFAVVAYGAVRWIGRQVQAADAARVEEPARLQRLMEVAFSRRDVLLAKGLVQNPKCPSQVLTRFAEADDWPELSRWNDSVGHLVRRNRRPVLQLVARHPNTPPTTLESMASRWPFLGADIVRNQNATASLLRRLAELEDRAVKQALARSDRTPLDVLSRLGRSEDLSVRFGVAANERTPLEDLSRLAQDPEAAVRRGLLSNKALPREMLSVLGQDQDAHIRSAAEARLRALG